MVVNEKPKYHDPSAKDLTNDFKSAVLKVFGLFFRALAFYKRNVVLLVLIVIIGGLIGYFLDTKLKMFSHSVIVQSNLKSGEFLHAKVNQLKKFLYDDDPQIWKSRLGLQKRSSIFVESIEPLIDIYDFINQKESNLELVRALSYKNNLERIVNEEVTQRIHSNYLITFISKDQIKKESILPFIEFLNESKYYDGLKVIHLQSIEKQVKEIDSTLSQINKILNAYHKSLSQPKNHSAYLALHTEYFTLQNVVESKKALLTQREELLKNQYNSDQLIKVVSIVENDIFDSLLVGNLKLLMPLFSFVMLSIVGFLIKIRYTIIKRQQNTVN